RDHDRVRHVGRRATGGRGGRRAEHPTGRRDAGRTPRPRLPGLLLRSAWPRRQRRYAALRGRTRGRGSPGDRRARGRDRVRVRSLVGRGAGAAPPLEVALEPPGITKLVLSEPPFIVDDSRPPLPDDYVAHLKALAATD